MAIAFEDSIVNNIRIVSLTGRLDVATVPLFDAHCAKQLEETSHKLILDFDGVDYLSSIALRSLLALHKKLEAVGGRLVVCCAKPVAKNIFEISGFSTFLHMADSLEKALGQVL